MYAVVETGGKQVRVTPGDVIQIEKIDGETGQEIMLDRVLMIADGEAFTIGTPTLAAKVKARIVALDKGPKISGMQFRRRKNFRQRYGHRQKLTRVEILAIETEFEGEGSVRHGS